MSFFSPRFRLYNVNGRILNLAINGRSESRSSNMKKQISENKRDLIIGAAIWAILICSGSFATPAQSTCLTAQAILAQKDTITKAETVKQRDCWVAKLKKGEKKMAGAFLKGANLSESETNPANYGNVDLTDANLSGADLTEAILQGAILIRADLTSATVKSVDLRWAKLAGANLNSANLTSSKFFKADLTTADPRGADLSDCKFLSYDESLARFRGMYSDEEFRRFSPTDLTRLQKELARDAEDMGTLKLKGAKISSKTKGTTAAYWKAHGGVVVD